MTSDEEFALLKTKKPLKKHEKQSVMHSIVVCWCILAYSSWHHVSIWHDDTVFPVAMMEFDSTHFFTIWVYNTNNPVSHQNVKHSAKRISFTITALSVFFGPILSYWHVSTSHDLITIKPNQSLNEDYENKMHQ